MGSALAGTPSDRLCGYVAEVIFTGVALLFAMEDRAHQRKRGLGRRIAKEKALRFVTSFSAKHFELLAGFDSFGEHRDRQALAQGQHRANNRFRLRAIGQSGDEEAIELDLVERKGAQRLQ